MKLSKVVISTSTAIALLVGGGIANADEVHDTALAVIKGDFGNGTDRENALKAKGLDYNEVQTKVNTLLTVPIETAPTVQTTAPVETEQPTAQPIVETPAPVVSAPVSTGSPQAAVQAAAAQHGWSSGSEWAAIDFIVSHESGWNANAKNPSSTAYGLFQMLVETSSNVNVQAQNGINYIASRYGTPTNAQAFWLAHNWY